MEYRHLPPADEGTEYAQRVVGSEVYVTTGLFPLGSESHKGEQLIRCPTLVLDFDLADWLQVPKSDLYGMDRDEIDTHLVELLETIELVVEQVAGVEPSAVVMSGYGFHIYLWTACGGHDLDHAKAVNRWLAGAINEAVGFAMADTNATFGPPVRSTVRVASRFPCCSSLRMGQSTSYLAQYLLCERSVPARPAAHSAASATPVEYSEYPTRTCNCSTTGAIHIRP